MRNLLLGLVLLPALLSGSPAGGLAAPEEMEVVETLTLSGEPYRVLLDPDDGKKWIEGPDGTRYESMAEISAENLRRIGDPLSRIDPSLRPLLDDPAAGAEPVLVVLVLGEQPLHDVAEGLREGLDADVERIMGPAREIWRRIESELPPPGTRERLSVGEQQRLEYEAMTPPERETVLDAVTTARERIREFRREALALAAPLAKASRSVVLARLADVDVTYESTLLNSIWVMVPAARLPDLLRASPEIAAALPMADSELLLNVSVPVTGASSFWTGTFTGSGVNAAVLDSGMDNQHPALKSAITSEKVFLASGKSASNFADDATKTDDLHGHGSHVAGIVGSRDSTYKGVAKGVSLVNAKCFYKRTDGKASATGQDIFAATVWAVGTANADVLNLSFGGAASTNDGDGALARFYDAVVHDLSVHVAAAAGNSGPSTGTVISPGDGFNVVTVGSWNDKGTTSLTDDAISSFSSRGPTVGGRRKPDISAPGQSIMSCNAAWEGSTADFKNLSGTSMATPHVAGALSLLTDYKSSYKPQSLRALLMNTARNSSPFPTTPDNTWGWGGMDLAAAYTARANVIESSLTSSGAQSLYYTRSTSLSTGDRATLAWNRHVTYSSTSWPGTSPSLLDLDLYLYDGTTGTEDTKSASTVNSAEQVKATGTVASPVLRVYRSGSFPSSFTTESFALAAPAGFTAATIPELTASFGSVTSPVAPGATFSVSVTVKNTGDLRAFSPKVTLTVPTGYSIQSGANPQTLSTIAGSGTAVASYTVKASSVTEKPTISASAATSSWNSTVTSNTASVSQQVDATAPTGSVSINSGASSTAEHDVTLTLTGTDTHSSVAKMRLRNEGGSWTSWETFATSRSWTLASGEGTRTVNAQFEDAVGNLSSTVSDSITVADVTAPTGSVVIDGGNTYTGSTSASLTLSASDAGSGVAEMRLRNFGDAWGSWETYATSRVFSLASGDGLKTVHVQFKDVAGNVSETASDTISLDQTAPTGTVVINGGSAYTSSTAATLGLTASDSLSGVAEMRVSGDGSSWSGWETFATSRVFTLASGDGLKTAHVQFRDSVGNASATLTDTITLDRTAPTGTVVIDGGEPATNSTAATLGLTASDNLSGVPEMRARASGDAWGPWETFATSRAFTLATGDGLKTAQVEFRDGAGNVSATVSDSILLDQTSPTGSVTIDDGAAWTGTASVTLDLTAADGGSGVSDMRFSGDGSTWTTWEAFASSREYSFATGDGLKTARVQYRDQAGNVSSTMTDTIGLDTTGPSGSVTVAGGASWTTTSSVTLGLLATDAGSGVAEMRFSSDGSTWSTWETYATSRAFSLAAGDGTKTAYVQYRDSAGNSSSTVTDTIGLDSAAPTGSVSVAGGAAWTKVASVALTLSATDTASGVAEMRFSTDGSTWSVWETYATSRAFSLATGDGQKTAYVQYRDTAGNASIATSDSIGLDGTAPTGSVTIAGGAAWTRTSFVTLGLSASDATAGVADMRFSSDGSTWSAWETYATTRAYFLSAGEGMKTVSVEVRDKAGNVSGTAKDSIGFDGTPPIGTVSVEGGASHTGSTAATLTLSASDAVSGVKEMRLSADGSLWGEWEAFAATRSWTLTTGDGKKRVYAEFRDAAQNVSSTVLSDIELDTTAPSGSLTIAGGAVYTNTTDVGLALAATDAGSGVTEMRFGTDGATWGAWETFAASRVFSLASGEGLNTVHVQFRDGVENVSPTASDAITYDKTAPTGSLVLEGGAAYTNSAWADLALAASDPLSGVADMRFSSDGASWGTWEAYDTTRTLLLGAEDGKKSAYVQFRDRAGNVSAAAFDDIELDRTAPTGTVTVNGGAGYTNSRSASLSLAASDALSGVVEMRLRNEDGAWGSWQPLATTLPWTLSAPEGTKSVRVEYRDRAGNVSATATASIVFDETPPTGSVVIDGGWPATNSTGVELTLTGTDAVSGVESMRTRAEGSAWPGWTPLAESAPFTLPGGAGAKTVELQLVDRSGNLSVVYSAAILLDQTRPAGSFVVNGGAPYVLPSEEVALDIDAADEAGGSGLRDLKVSYDAGATWSSWHAISSAPSVTVPGPASSGLLSATVVFRDVAGNESDPADSPLYQVTESPRVLLPGTKLAGSLSGPLDVDPVAIDLVKGDLLSAKLKAKAETKGESLLTAIDLIGPWGSRAFTGGFPPGAKKPGIKKYEVTVTGRYVIIVRRDAASEAAKGTYLLNLTVKQARENKKRKGESVTGSVFFDASEGSLLKGWIKGGGLTAAAIEILGPEGAVGFKTKERNGKVTILTTALMSGTGTYEIRVATPGAVTYSLAVKLPPKPRGNVLE